MKHCLKKSNKIISNNNDNNFLEISVKSQVWPRTPLIPGPGRQRQANLCGLLVCFPVSFLRQGLTVYPLLPCDLIYTQVGLIFKVPPSQLKLNSETWCVCVCLPLRIFLRQPRTKLTEHLLSNRSNRGTGSIKLTLLSVDIQRTKHVLRLNDSTGTYPYTGESNPLQAV